MTSKTNSEPETTSEAPTLTSSEVATFLGVSPKVLRRYIRNSGAACGKGNRYGFSAEEAKALIESFKARPQRSAATTRSAEELAELLS